ncbi:hypothetical protein BSU04_33940 [Caballeronia sordidicola]|uniref:Uncharacterized protein n=1 Tax=Caballeronia sordidicola TaxID=196367 RepID=A0A226WRZ4_CABSO|nr:hypothetical protein BSU04_33940 [Caballeronia sordidicola]
MPPQHIRWLWQELQDSRAQRRTEHRLNACAAATKSMPPPHDANLPPGR